MAQQTSLKNNKSSRLLIEWIDCHQQFDTVVYNNSILKWIDIDNAKSAKKTLPMRQTMWRTTQSKYYWIKYILLTSLNQFIFN